jgi:hypothetical protein
MHIYNLSQHQFYKRGRTRIKQSNVISKCMAEVAVVFTLSDSFFRFERDEKLRRNEAILVCFIAFSRVRTRKLMK